MKHLALFFTLILLSTSGLAASVTVDIFGTNASNAQSNLTKTGNNSYQVVQWAVGDSTKSLKADINGNASDSFTFTLHNFTAGRVIEVKVNSSAFNSYQADSTGIISFTRVQTVRNQTYSFTPAVNSGGYNFTWFQLWTWPSLFGVNFTQYFLPYSGATADLDMNNRNITNVKIINSTTVNVTTLNATNVQGNGSGITYINLSNGSQPVPNASIPASAANLSENNTFTGIGTTSFAGRVDIKEPDEVLNTYGNINIFTTDASAIDKGGAIGFGGETAQGTTPYIFGKIKGAAEGASSYNGYLAFGINLGGGINERMRIRSNGNVGIGNTTPEYNLTVGTSPWSGMNAGDATFTTSSSRDLKKDIQDINISNSAERISRLKPSTYRWNTSNASREIIWGLIADDTNQVYPEMENGTINWNMVLTDLVATTKQLVLENQELKKRIARLENP